jgi:pimeloyl-ACP methyl ester carboxylesterase
MRSVLCLSSCCIPCVRICRLTPRYQVNRGQWLRHGVSRGGLWRAHRLGAWRADRLPNLDDAHSIVCEALSRYCCQLASTQLGVAPATRCEQIAKFSFRILILHGENSPKNCSAMSAAMRNCRPMAEPIVVPNAAHNMFIDNTPVFNLAVLGFLSHD